MAITAHSVVAAIIGTRPDANASVLKYIKQYFIMPELRTAEFQYQFVQRHSTNSLEILSRTPGFLYIANQLHQNENSKSKLPVACQLSSRGLIYTEWPYIVIGN